MMAETIGLKLPLVNCFIFLMLSWILQELGVGYEGVSDCGELLGPITCDDVTDIARSIRV